MLNTCSFIGRLVVDPELKTTSSGTQFVKARIAVQRDIAKNGGNPDSNGYKQYDSDFIPFAVWGKTAPFAAKMVKGQMVSVSGRMQTSQYTDQQGNKQTGFELNVESWYMLDKKNTENNNNSGNGNGGFAQNQGGFQQQPQQYQPQQPQQYQQQYPQQPQQQSNAGFGGGFAPNGFGSGNFDSPTAF